MLQEGGQTQEDRRRGTIGWENVSDGWGSRVTVSSNSRTLQTDSKEESFDPKKTGHSTGESSLAKMERSGQKGGLKR